MARMNKATHYEEWAALWEAAKDVSKGKTSWDRNARESFELVAIALLYQRNAIEMYEEEARHGALRTSEAGAGPSIPWPSEEPLFPKMMESTDAKLGNSFIASGSLRLPVAVLKAIESFVSPSQKIGREIPTRDPSSAAMLVPRRTPRPRRTGRRRRRANHIGKESANGAGQGHQADVGWPARVTSTRGRRGCVSIISVGTLQGGRGRRERE